MKRSMKIWKLLSIMLAFCLILSGMVFAGEEAGESTEPETVVAAPLQLKTLGQESEDVYQVKITNNTGKDIAFFAIDFYDPDPMAYNLVYQMQEALIQAGFLEGEADGSAGPMTQEAIRAYREANGLSADGGADDAMLEKLLGAGYDGNIMDDGDVFTAGETRILLIPKTKPADEKTPASEEAEAPAEEEPADALTEALKSFSITPEYVISFRGQEDDTTYYLYAFPAGIMQTAQLNIDGETPYVMYTVTSSPEPVSTLDAEKAAAKVMGGSVQMPEAADAGYDVSYDANADTGYAESYDTGYDVSYDANTDTGYAESYDTGYDVSYDTGDYTEYVEPEPAYEAPYIVTEENYPSCDDGSHGVIYRVWSDGTEERIDY